MKKIALVLLAISLSGKAQKIAGIQLFNPKTNDETPVIGFNDHLFLRFDDLSNGSTQYRYTIKHYDRNWQDDGLFFTEIASGTMSGLIENYQYSFNTLQKYTHYELEFPNDKMQPKISGNFELIVYQDNAEKPLFTKKFFVIENNAALGLNLSRTQIAGSDANQRVEVQASATAGDFNSVVNSLSLTVFQNNNHNISVSGLRPTSVFGGSLVFQQMDLSFPGNSEFYYFDNKIMNQPFDMVAGTESKDSRNYTYLHPVLAYPQAYQSQPDANGAYYFRRNDLGIERDADKEGDYSWVFFALDSDKISKEIFVLGDFNDYQPSRENQMFYDENSKKYIAKIYLKQGFYNYILATKGADGVLNFGEINGNFWQTQNLYQALLYYTPFGKNYDGLLGYGESKPVVR